MFVADRCCGLAVPYPLASRKGARARGAHTDRPKCKLLSAGLDPANPLFYQLGAEHIDEKSGRLVDIVHTDGGVYGAYGRTGSVDFFANGGSRPQPGCNLLGVPLTPRSTYTGVRRSIVGLTACRRANGTVKGFALT